MYLKYRPEIDSLRAFAIIPVVLFHANLKYFSGGFVGVDIFFVISGYLITSIILRDLENGKFSLINFFNARIKRLLPLLSLVCLITTLVCLFILPQDDFKDLALSNIAVLTYWSNFFFENMNNYFDKSSEFIPLLHTWSLSVEEQFYIIFPILMLFFYKLKIIKLNYLILFGTIFSFFIMQFGGNLKFNFPYIESQFFLFSNSLFNKFMLPYGRIWELGAGSLVAIYLSNKKNIISNNLYFNNLIISLSLILIIFSILFFNKSTPYPSIYTLIPVVATSALIIFLSQASSFGFIFKNKYLISLGLISYSIYLIHYPFFSILNYLLIKLSLLNLIFSLLVILLVSFLSWKFFELPIRKKYSNKTLYLTLLATYTLTIFFSLLVINEKIKIERFAFKESIKSSLDIQSREGNKCFDINFIFKSNDLSDFCIIGNDKKDKIDFIVTGDSHLVSYYNIFDNFSKENNKKGIFVGYSGCTPFLSIFPVRSDQNIRNCNKLNLKLLHFAKEFNIKNLILIGRWDYYTLGGQNGHNFSFIDNKNFGVGNSKVSNIAFKKGLKKTIKNYKEIGTRVHLIKQPPFQELHAKYVFHYLNKQKISNKNIVNDILAKHSIDIKKNKNFNKKINILFDAEKNKNENLYLYNPEKLFCENVYNKCLIGNQKYSYYIDENHISINGANLLKPMIKNILNNFL